MAWLILPPQHLNEAEPKLRVGKGLSKNYSTPEAYQAILRGNLASSSITPHQLPITRDPEMVAGPIVMPDSFTVLDQSGLLKDKNEQLPDVLFGGSYSWFVSERVKKLMEQVSFGVARFDQINLQLPGKVSVPEPWYMLSFLQYADIIDEEISDLIWYYLFYGGWISEDDQRRGVLYSKSDPVPDYHFWSGGRLGRYDPLNAASIGFTYCSDRMMDAFREHGVCGFGSAVPIRTPDERLGTVAPFSPRVQERIFVESDETIASIVFPVQRFGGISKAGDITDAADNRPFRVTLPNEPSLPDIWTMERHLVVSAEARHIFEQEETPEVAFELIESTPDKSGKVYNGPKTYFVMSTPLLRPYVHYMSRSLVPGILSDGNLRLTENGSELTLDGERIGGHTFWNSVPPGTGSPCYYIAGSLLDAMNNAKITGIPEYITWLRVFRQNDESEFKPT